MNIELTTAPAAADLTFGTLDGQPAGHRLHFMRKRLA